MKKKNGFTLVELLAVIVILAIILVLAVPSVLDALNKARKSTFVEYIDKVARDAQTQYLYDANLGNIKGAGWYVYDIKQDLGSDNTGNFKGYVTVNATDVDDVHYIIELYDNNYMINNYDYTVNKAPTENSAYITAFNSNTVAKSNLQACQNAAGKETNPSCYTRQGYLITP